jgi:hypothetical protein
MKPILTQFNEIHTFPAYLKFILILSSITYLSIPSGLIWGFLTKI